MVYRDHILALIDSLQQEQPEQKKKCDDCPHCVDRKDQNGWHFKGCAECLSNTPEEWKI